MHPLCEALDNLFKNSKIRKKLLLATGCLGLAIAPAQASEDTAREQALVVRHSSAIHLQTLKNQLQKVSNTVFIAADRRREPADLPIGDVIDIDSASVHRACEEGELFLLPVSQLPASLDLASVRDDYLPGTLSPCGVGHTLSSSVIAYRRTHGEPQPAILGDFFDLEAFPGLRAMRRSPRGIAERALLAYGIAADQLYPTLQQPDKAWPIIEHALNSLRDQIHWVENDQLAILAMETMPLRFAVISGQMAARHSALRGAANWQILWDQALYQLHMWAIPVSTRNQSAAWSLIQQLSEPQINGRYATSAGNGPARRSAMSLVSAEYQKLLPGYANNASTLVLQNDQWWANNQARYQLLFDRWMKNQPTNRNTSDSANHMSPPAGGRALPSLVAATD